MCGSENFYDRYRIMFLKGKPMPTESLDCESVQKKTFFLRTQII